jgi:hypothetical protein
MIKASTQIYKKETLIKLYGEEDGIKRWGQTSNEVIFQTRKRFWKRLYIYHCMFIRSIFIVMS